MNHLEWVLRLVLSTICGCIIGYERSSRYKEAGIRTHGIVCMASACIMIVSKYGFSGGDPARIAAQVVSGIGFLGAGMIYVRNGSISGLTTAAGVWATSGVGLCFGAGLYDMGICSTILIYGLQMLLHNDLFFKITHNVLHIQVETIKGKGIVTQLQSELIKHAVTVHDLRVDKSGNSMTIYFEGSVFKDFNRDKLMEEILDLDYVQSFKYL